MKTGENLQKISYVRLRNSLNGAISSIKSLAALQKIKEMSVLLSSWDEPRYGESCFSERN